MVWVVSHSVGGSLSIDFVYFVEFVPTKSRGFRTPFIILLGIMACTLMIPSGAIDSPFLPISH